MSKQKITVELTEDEARDFLRVTGANGIKGIPAVHRAIAAALPPEWAAETIADLVWDDGDRRRAWWTGELWTTLGDYTDPGWTPGYRVEPLRVLADGEIAVPEPDLSGFNGQDVRRIASLARTGPAHFVRAPAWLDRVADVLDGLDR